MLDRAIGIIGVALALAFGAYSLSPEGWPKMPGWLVYAGVAAGIFLGGLSLGLIAADKRNELASAIVDSAELRLQMYGDSRTPTRLTATNIWRWYYLKTVFVTIEAATGSKTEHPVGTLFVTFDPQVRTGTLEVSSPDIALPQFEVKEFQSRFAIIAFSGPIPAGTLVITVHS